MPTVTTSESWLIARSSSTAAQAYIGQAVNEPITLPPTTETKTYSFSSTSADLYEDIRFGYDATTTLSAATLVNCTAVYRKNGSIVTGAQTFAIGDTLRIDITRTVPATLASVTLIFAYADNIVTATTPDYFWASWTNLTTGVNEMVVEPNRWVSNKNGLRSAGTSIASWNSRNANSVEALSGTFTIEVYNMGWQSTISLSATNTGAQSFFSDKYAVLNNIGGLYAWENGSQVADMTPAAPYVSGDCGVRIVDTGTSIQYWRQDVRGGAWVLAHTSAAVYVPNATYYISFGVLKPNTLIEGVKIYP